MPKKLDNGWECNVCHLVYPRDIEAVKCEKEHDLILVPISRSDLFRLVQFIITKDEHLLTESLMKTLMKYSSNMSGRA